MICLLFDFCMYVNIWNNIPLFACVKQFLKKKRIAPATARNCTGKTSKKEDGYFHTLQYTYNCKEYNG